MSEMSSREVFGCRFRNPIKLGNGEYGDVYKAYDNSSLMNVAIKIYKNSSNDKLGINMTVIREISLLKQLNHPNLVNVVDVIVGHDSNPDCLFLILVSELFIIVTSY